MYLVVDTFWCMKCCMFSMHIYSTSQSLFSHRVNCLSCCSQFLFICIWVWWKADTHQKVRMEGDVSELIGLCGREGWIAENSSPSGWD